MMDVSRNLKSTVTSPEREPGWAFRQVVAGRKESAERYGQQAIWWILNACTNCYSVGLDNEVYKIARLAGHFGLAYLRLIEQDRIGKLKVTIDASKFIEQIHQVINELKRSAAPPERGLTPDDRYMS